LLLCGPFAHAVEAAQIEERQLGEAEKHIHGRPGTTWKTERTTKNQGDAGTVARKATTRHNVMSS